MMLIRFIKSRWTYVAIRLIGLGLLVGYLTISSDWRFSFVWALIFAAIMLSVAWLVVGLRLRRRFPKLDRYFLYPATEGYASGPSSGDEWALKKANYLLNGFRGTAILSAPAEDGLICVPVLLVGISALSAPLGGVAFGLIHLGRFTYLECLAKGVTYTLACAFVLPHGLLTVVVGHLVIDGLAFVTLQALRRKLSM